jgi:hypothetical protein
MDAGRLEAKPLDVEASVGRAAGLVRVGLTSFLEGNPFRGRRVQEDARQLQADVDLWQDDALTAWPEDEADFERRLALSHQVEALARSAQQLAALAESRPSTQVQAGLRDAVRDLAQPLEPVLDLLGDPLAPHAGDALAGIRAKKAAFLEHCTTLGRKDPRLFSSCLLAVAAGQRIEEAAEAAMAAANLVALRAVVA